MLASESERVPGRYGVDEPAGQDVAGLLGTPSRLLEKRKVAGSIPALATHPDPRNRSILAILFQRFAAFGWHSTTTWDAVERSVTVCTGTTVPSSGMTGSASLTD